MAGQSRKWMILVATIWIQAFTGTNFDFSEYSSAMKSVLNISQVQLNYLATASDMGKVFGWSSGLALMYLPISVVMFIAAFMGFVGYGLQWLLINNIITLPYFLVRYFSLQLMFSFYFDEILSRGFSFRLSNNYHMIHINISECVLVCFRQLKEATCQF